MSTLAELPCPTTCAVNFGDEAPVPGPAPAPEEAPMPEAYQLVNMKVAGGTSELLGWLAGRGQCTSNTLMLCVASCGPSLHCQLAPNAVHLHSSSDLACFPPAAGEPEDFLFRYGDQLKTVRRLPCTTWHAWVALSACQCRIGHPTSPASCVHSPFSLLQILSNLAGIPVGWIVLEAGIGAQSVTTPNGEFYPIVVVVQMHAPADQHASIRSSVQVAAGVGFSPGSYGSPGGDLAASLRGMTLPEPETSQVDLVIGSGAWTGLCDVYCSVRTVRLLKAPRKRLQPAGRLAALAWSFCYWAVCKAA